MQPQPLVPPPAAGPPSGPRERVVGARAQATPRPPPPAPAVAPPAPRPLRLPTIRYITTFRARRTHACTKRIGQPPRRRLALLLASCHFPRAATVLFPAVAYPPPPPFLPY